MVYDFFLQYVVIAFDFSLEIFVFDQGLQEIV